MDPQETSAEPTQSHPFWKSWKLLLILLVVVLIIAGIFGITRLSSSNAPVVTKPSAEVNQWPSYTNSEEKFSFRYPPGWTLEETASLPNAVKPTLVYEPNESCSPRISIIKSTNVADLGALTPILYQTVEGYMIVAYATQKDCALTEESAGNTATALSEVRSTFKLTK